ncbi:MAG TPA: hypothetical protein VK395_08000 [Gemmataceae bacterium]|nr:hypothetical protein [Gemmataceae bacterium]
MRSIMLLACVAGVVFGVAGVSRAEEQAQAVINKAIKARGSEEALSKYKAVTFKGKGVFYGFGDGIAYKIEAAEQLPNRHREVINADSQGNSIKRILVVNDDSGWLNLNDSLQELDKDKLDKEKAPLHANFVASLVPLKDKSYTLKYLGDSKQGDRLLVGVKVSSKGNKDVSLYFDKDTGLLVKAAYKGYNASGEEGNQEAIFSDYKEFDGLKEPTKITIKHNGDKYNEIETTELQHHEKLDDGVFAKP